VGRVASQPDDAAGRDPAATTFVAEDADIRILRPSTGTAVLELHGEYDLVTRGRIDALLTGLVEANDVVVVDLSETSFVDSSFLHNLVQGDRRARARGSRFRVQLAPEAVAYRAFEVSGLLRELDVVPDRAQALLSD
jgi:anti-anti-sigma factor